MDGGTKMMWLIVLSLVGSIILLIIGYSIRIYNIIQVAVNDYSEKWAEIKTEYQRRLDMLGNTVRAVKSHAKFEKETLAEIAKARAGISKSTKPSKNAVQKIESSLMKLHAQFEAYPQLKSNEHYSCLMVQIEDTENRIFLSRDQLNEIARDFNTFISQIPAKFWANWYKAKKMTYFESTENATTSYTVDM